MVTNRPIGTRAYALNGGEAAFHCHPGIFGIKQDEFLRLVRIGFRKLTVRSEMPIQVDVGIDPARHYGEPS